MSELVVTAEAPVTRYEQARALLQAAASVDDVMFVRDDAERMKLYARQAKNHGLMADAAEIRLRAERRLGEMIIEAKKAGQIRVGRPASASAENPSAAEGFPATPAVMPIVLADAGIDHKLSANAQKMAALQSQEFEQLAQLTRDKILLAKAIVVNPAKDLTTADKKVSRAKKEAELGAKQRALPDKQYGVIYADPEWRFEVRSRESGLDRAADNHYPTSDLNTIKARDVAAIAAKDCVLFLWATAPMLPDAIEVMEAWGFRYKSHFVWKKVFPGGQKGTGYWNRNEHELLLVGVRGSPPAPAPGLQWSSVINAPVGRHSEKPGQFAQLIEAYFPTLPKIELNARAARPGWDVWGNEVEGQSAVGSRQSGETSLAETVREAVDAGVITRAEVLGVVVDVIKDPLPPPPSPIPDGLDSNNLPPAASGPPDGGSAPQGGRAADPAHGAPNPALTGGEVGVLPPGGADQESQAKATTGNPAISAAAAPADGVASRPSRGGGSPAPVSPAGASPAARDGADDPTPAALIRAGIEAGRPLAAIAAELRLKVHSVERRARAMGLIGAQQAKKHAAAAQNRRLRIGAAGAPGPASAGTEGGTRSKRSPLGPLAGPSSPKGERAARGEK